MMITICDGDNDDYVDDDRMTRNNILIILLLSPLNILPSISTSQNYTSRNVLKINRFTDNKKTTTQRANYKTAVPNTCSLCSLLRRNLLLKPLVFLLSVQFALSYRSWLAFINSTDCIISSFLNRIFKLGFHDWLYARRFEVVHCSFSDFHKRKKTSIYV